MRVFLTATLALTLMGCNPLANKAQQLGPSADSEVPAATQTTGAQPLTSASPVDKVHIVKFLDYGCGHCRDAHFTVKSLETQFGDKVKFEVKHFPLSAETFLVAETAECARMQGEDKFLAYHNELLEYNFRQYTPDNLQAVAAKALLNTDEFNTCAASGVAKVAVQEDVDEAKKLGVSGTPYFLLNDSVPLSGAIPEQSFARLIQQVLDGESL